MSVQTLSSKSSEAPFVTDDLSPDRFLTKAFQWYMYDIELLIVLYVHTRFLSAGLTS